MHVYVSTYGFRCHYSRGFSSAGLDGSCVCVCHTRGDNLCHNESFTCAPPPSFHWPTQTLPLHLTPWKSMRASRSGVKIELLSKYFACWKLKVSGRGGAWGTGNCCVAGEDLHRDFMYVSIVYHFSLCACADVHTFRYIFKLTPRVPIPCLCSALVFPLFISLLRSLLSSAPSLSLFLLFFPFWTQLSLCVFPPV